MKCFCGTELIWGGDHADDDDEDWAMESNYHCPECKRTVMIYTPHVADSVPDAVNE